ncbi:hypothetical protein NMS_0904 [Nonlabens marinus S1-08]|uniref:Uncharacterized protein n=1 Tax=Nonlabens marinus S1-08 TaxID=1454201 RepID=W8VUU9_9FLAO|nr:hypothetical protein NMS_0904 [Nonlabens marinus S1-08]
MCGQSPNFRIKLKTIYRSTNLQMKSFPMHCVNLQDTGWNFAFAKAKH